MADKNYLGLGVIFKGIDKGLTKTAKDVQYNLLRTDKQIKNVQDSIDNFDFKPVKDFFKQDTSKFTRGLDKAFQSKWTEFKDLNQFVSLIIGESKCAVYSSLNPWIDSIQIRQALFIASHNNSETISIVLHLLHQCYGLSC